MSDRLQQFRNQVSDGHDHWRAMVTLPWVQAYSAAYDDFRTTLDAQKDADKENAELFVTALSVVSGTILMATLAQSSLRVLAGEAALQVVCNRNLTATFNLMAATVENRAAMFAIGGLLDGVDDHVKKKTQEIVRNYLHLNSSVITSSPVAKFAQLDQYLLNNKLCAFDCAKAINDDKQLGEPAKAAHFKILLQAPIANTPKGMINPTQLMPKVELALFMCLILGTAELIDWPGYYMGGESAALGSTVGAKSQPINVLPSSPKFPHPSLPQPVWGYMPAYQSVGISRPGSKIRDKIDELHKSVFGQAFYDSAGWFSSPDNMKELRHAETVLGKLGNATRPATWLDVHV